MSEDDTLKVIDHHVSALLVGDVDGLMEDYHKNAKLITNIGVIASGAEAIRDFFDSLSISFDGFEVTFQHVEDSFVVAAWKTAAIPFAADTFTLQHGKILIQTAVAYMPES
jgi:hypothetical protein